MTSTNVFGAMNVIAAFVVVWAAIYFIRYRIQLHFLRRLDRAAYFDRDELIASLRLRLPPGSDLVGLEHEMFFRDERNRTAAAQVFTKNGFEVRTTETYESETRYWLLATRSTLVDKVPEEVERVINFSTQYGGRYAKWNPQF